MLIIIIIITIIMKYLELTQGHNIMLTPGTSFLQTIINRFILIMLILIIIIIIMIIIIMKYLELTQGHNILMLTQDFIPHSSSNIRQTVINHFI